MTVHLHKLKLLWALAALALVASACGLLSGDDDDAIGTLEGEDGQPLVLPTPTPTATPTPRPEPTARPTATPPPTPTPTPSVPDTYTDLLADVRALFVSSDLQADVGAIVPLPFSIPVPPDAQLERVDLQYRQWDVWANLTGDFPPVDTPADVEITLVFLTEQGIDDLRTALGEPAVAAGYEVASDNYSEGSFSDVSYELNGGLLSRGRDGAYRVNMFAQGDATFVEVAVGAELTEDSQPRIIQWPELLTVPFSGAFHSYGADAVRGNAGVQVNTQTRWIIGSRGNSQSALMATLANEYPHNGVTIDEIVETAPTDPASASLGHPTGSTGRVFIDFETNLSFIDFTLASLPG